MRVRVPSGPQIKLVVMSARKFKDYASRITKKMYDVAVEHSTITTTLISSGLVVSVLGLLDLIFAARILQMTVGDPQIYFNGAKMEFYGTKELSYLDAFLDTINGKEYTLRGSLPVEIVGSVVDSYVKPIQLVQKISGRNFLHTIHYITVGAAAALGGYFATFLIDNTTKKENLDGSQK